MTNSIQSALKACINTPPDDLVALYTSPLPIYPDLRIAFLILPDAINYTHAIHERTLLGTSMGLFALNDANDSNPYCYITRGPAKGCILHLHHDGDVVIEYTSLAAFLDAVCTAMKQGLPIEDLPGKDFRPKIDQDYLCDHISHLIAIDSDEAECELTVLTPLLDTARVDSVRALSEHSSFFVREAVARLITSQPNAHLIKVAELLANDRHSQVAQPGKRALSAVNNIARLN
ncbi:hypothetical protein HED60_11900 [Planctomycetales bacterium ZRK34]|nr:hypothetical protein HED60_11900 [Planctomycetales bacterium ZRK34]